MANTLYVEILEVIALELASIWFTLASIDEVIQALFTKESEVIEGS